jgi:hypothetical protein
VRLGELSLSENLFFLGHDPFTGKPRTRPDILDIGLAGAVLADLVFDERIALNRGSVIPVNRHSNGDLPADHALSHIIAESGTHGVRDWVEHLRDRTTSHVVDGLTARQLVSPKESRGLLRRSMAYPPVDLRTASAPRARIRSAMLGRTVCDAPTATLALLAWAMGLDDIAEPDLSRRQTAEWTDNVRTTIGPPIAGLVAGTEAAIAANVYGGNRG